ncbi:CRISPR-associated helicase Cas3' [Nocardiopsis sp. HNM0947]|uniref:CRISPR-associated helicase Cas3 n=1 Tax=Nocardiopsis coralli TaxID=2772213 RepID=A0ABR9P469_9ACTN|nr:CRISPR-associated helicase Cas3' [Nocardiopsis coralli]MBE2998642.1 CRISPR-associated helicase Cas3' [Nocardiopsis coralli]
MPWAKHTSRLRPKHGPKERKTRQGWMHPLVCHLIDTMEVARLLYHRFLGPEVRKELDEVFRPLTDGDSQQTVKWVALLCGLHDLGKFSPAFQGVSVEVAKKRFPHSEHELLDGCAARRGRKQDTPHGISTGVHLDVLLRGLDAPVTTRIVLSQVLAGHHGYFPPPSVLARYRDARGGLHREDIGQGLWREGRSAMLHELARLAGVVFDDPRWADVRVTSRAVLCLAGLTTISDWLASDTTYFPYAKDPDCLDEYRARSEARAHRAMNVTGWHPWRPGEHTGFTDIFAEQLSRDSAETVEPRPLQREVEQLVDTCREPGVLVIEAPTGEGKTKAGLQAAARLSHVLGLGGLYYSTPTRELSRQTYDDARALLDGLGSDLEVNVVYSGSAKEQKEIEAANQATAGSTINPTGVEGEDDAGEDGCALRAWDWFASKKGLAFPVGVGTVDQALKSVIRGGHNFLGMAALSNKVVVIDEVHSYGAYTTRIVKQLIWYCGWLGSPVVLMSATLSPEQRVELIEEWHAGAEGRVPLPQSTKDTGSTPWKVTWSRDMARPRTFRLSEVARKRGPVRLKRLPESPETIADHVEKLVDQDGTALVVLNTTARAKTVHDLLEERYKKRSGSPELIHFEGDHQGEQRREIKGRIDAHLGKKSLPDRHAIVVGTPVLEHGMDIDADVLVSDLCPIDLLFQRTGRLHRHARGTRPSNLSVPTLYVADIEPAVLAAVPAGKKRKNLKFTPYVSNVYEQWILGRSRAILEEVFPGEQWRPFDEVGEQIHRVYSEADSIEPEKGWEDAWRAAERKYLRKLEDMEADARAVLIPLLRGPQQIHLVTERRAPAGSTRQSQGSHDDRKYRRP